MARPVPVTLWILASLAPLAVSTAPALGAEPAAAPSASASDPSIADHVRRGDKARVAGRWREAAAAYAEALAAAERAGLPEKERAVIVGELGAAEVELGQYRDGAEHLHRSLVSKPAVTAEQKERHRRARKKAAAEVGTMIVGVNPPDAEVSLDRTEIPERSSSHVLFVEPGQHTIRARRTGFADATITQNMAKGSKVQIALRLERAPARQPAAAVPCVEPAGKSAPSAPCPTTRDWTADLRTGALITAGVGAGVGAGLLLFTIPVNDAIQEQKQKFLDGARGAACMGARPPAECAEQEARLTARSWMTGVGWVSLGVSGMIATVAASSYLFSDSPGDAAPVRVVPIASGDQMGAVVVGVW